jgi:hypothetical protein
LFRFWRKKLVFDFDAALARFESISEPMYVRLNPPVVGRDQEADAWVCDAYREGRITAKSEAKALAKFEGYRVLQLLPVCDGFPVYCSYEQNSEVDRTSFYGSVLGGWDTLDGTGLITDMHGPLLASELAAWAEKLHAWADDFAKTHNMSHIIGYRDYYAEDPSGPDTCLHIVDQLARWATYWSSRGHGSEPIFDFSPA